MPLLLTFILLFLAALHLYHNWRIQPHSLYLSGALISISYHFVIHYLFIFGTSVFWLAVLFGHGTPLIYLIGPLLFFYVRGVLADNTRLKKRDYLHFLPAFLDLIARTPYFLKPWSHKVWMAGEMVHDIRRLHDLADEFFPPSYIALPLRVVTMIGYTVYSLWMVWQFWRHYSLRTRVPIQAAKVPIRFLNYLLGVCLLAEVCLLIMLVKFLTDKRITAADVMQNPLLFISFFGILSIPLIIQLHPEVLYGIPRWREKEAVDLEVDAVVGPQAISAGEEGKGSTEVGWDLSAQASEKFNELTQRITSILDAEKPYLHPEFSLDDLARLLSVPKHHLYYCFNHILQKRFTQMRAELRVRHASNLIRNGATQEKTLEAIGIESGFSSRSSFIMAFREVTGMTPGEFQRSLERK